MNKLLPVLCFVVLLTSIPFSQQLSVQGTVANPVANFNISFVDLTGAGNGPTLFILNVAGGGPSGQRYVIEFTARCTTSVMLGIVYQGTSRSFTLPSGLFRSIPSNQFFNDISTDSMCLHGVKQKLDSNNVFERVLVGGMVPSGQLYLQFQLKTINGTNVGPLISLSVNVVSIRYVKLITPGVDASQRAFTIPEVFTPFPQFVWTSDLLPISYPANVVKFVVSVFENQDNRSRLSDIANTRPVWSTEIRNQDATTSAQYPLSGAPALKKGQLYYWQVKAILLGPEKRELASELFVFKAATIDFAQNITPLQNDILNYLEAILGSNYGYIVHDLREMVPVGTIMIQGQLVDVEKLRVLAEQFRRNEFIVRKVSIE